MAKITGKTLRLAALQFAPKLGARTENMIHAESLLAQFLPRVEDRSTMLVLPEFALSGYDFESPYAIYEHLEFRGGPTTQWASEVARKFNSHVAVGYPEKVDSIERYNSVVVVNPKGEEIWHYRKTHLYKTDHDWECYSNPDGFGKASSAVESEDPAMSLPSFQVGICMDLNPCEFKAPWNALEFARSVEQNKPSFVICPMSWAEEPDSLYEDDGADRSPHSPDRELVEYWRARFPLNIPAVFANRYGKENAMTYGGSTTIWNGKSLKSLGRREDGVLIEEIEL